MRTALVGHTGFIGQHLAAAFAFTDHYHRQNIAELKGRSYDALVCAAPSGNKLLANVQPEYDRQAVAQLLEVLQTVSCQRVILVSTVSTQDPVECCQPYGAHRLWLEEALLAHFGECLTILHLPMVFGPGAKKGLIRDLLVGIPLYLKADLVKHHQLKSYYRANALGQLWEWTGQDTADLRQRLTQADLSSRDFWPLDQRHRLVFVTDLASAISDHLRLGSALAYPSYEVTARELQEIFTGHPPAHYPNAFLKALQQTQKDRQMPL